MPKFRPGDKWEMLTIIEVIPRDPRARSEQYYRCQCSCGTVKVIRGSNLRPNQTRGCGCPEAIPLGEEAHRTDAARGSSAPWHSRTSRCNQGRSQATCAGNTMTDRRIPPGLAGDAMLALGVLAWCVGFAIGYVAGRIERIARRMA